MKTPIDDKINALVCPALSQFFSRALPALSSSQVFCVCDV